MRACRKGNRLPLNLMNWYKLEKVPPFRKVLQNICQKTVLINDHIYKTILINDRICLSGTLGRALGPAEPHVAASAGQGQLPQSPQSSRWEQTPCPGPQATAGDLNPHADQDAWLGSFA